MARKKAEESNVLEVPKTVPVSQESEAKQEKPKAAKSQDLVDVLKERVEILTENVKGFERLQERVRGLEGDIVDITNVLSLMFGGPLKAKLTEIAVRHIGRR